jgi:hypothetical protein
VVGGVRTCVSIAVCLWFAQSVSASPTSYKVRDFVERATRDQATLIAKFPALAQVDGVIREDCAAKATGEQASGAYCGCAAAVTMGFWRAMPDKMLPRLNDYLRDPTAAAARVLLQYQGPELYRPVCTEGTK